jgi:predicted benzoate:H+ symporter BenE
VGGVGLAALGVGSVFGVEALQKRRDSDALCNGNTCRAQAGVDLNADAQRFATYANVGIGVGVVGLVAGTYLVLTSGAPNSVRASTAGRLRLSPMIGAGCSAVDLSGTW